MRAVWCMRARHMIHDMGLSSPMGRRGGRHDLLVSWIHWIRTLQCIWQQSWKTWLSLLLLLFAPKRVRNNTRCMLPLNDILMLNFEYNWIVWWICGSARTHTQDMHIIKKKIMGKSEVKQGDRKCTALIYTLHFSRDGQRDSKCRTNTQITKTDILTFHSLQLLLVCCGI